MRRLRHSIIALLLALTLFYNLERLDFGVENIVDVHSFVYGIGVLALVAILAFQPLRRLTVWKLLALWEGLYLVARVFLFNDAPIIGGVYTYITITEIGLLGLLVWLAHGLSQDILDFEEAVENITLPGMGRKVMEREEAVEEIETEILRSRRHQHPLSVLVVRPDTDSIQANLHRTIQEVQRSMLARYVNSSLARVISQELRRTELVLEEWDKGRFIILSPETGAEGCTVLASRIREAAQRLGVSVACGVSTFPDEALTFEELVRQAEQDLKHQVELPVEMTYVPLNAEDSVSSRT